MSRWIHVTLIAAFFMTLGACGRPSRAAGDSAELRDSLHATAEEWTVLYPKLEQIQALRAEVTAVAPATVSNRANAMPGFMGNTTSLEAPSKPGSGIGGGISGFLGGGGPFDPKNAPGAVAPGLGSLLGSAIGGMVKTNQGNSVQALLRRWHASVQVIHEG